MLPADWLEQLRKAYPRRDGGQGWANVSRLVVKAIGRGSTWNRMISGTLEYARECQRKGHVGTELVKQAQTFYGPGEWWEEYADLGIERRLKELERRARSLGFSAVSDDLKANPDALEAKLNQAEADAAEKRKARDMGNVTSLTSRLRA